MSKFPECTGFNCFLEVMRSWIIYTTGMTLSTPVLFLSSGRLGFQYEAVKDNETVVFPRVKLSQYYDYDSLKNYLGINVVRNEPAEEAAWTDIENMLAAGKIPIVKGLSSLLPNKPDVQPTVTLLAVHHYNEQDQTVTVSSTLYNGTISLEVLQQIRSAIKDYNEPEYSWIYFEWEKELTEISADYLLNRVRDQLAEEDFKTVSPQKIREFATALKDLVQVKSFLRGVILKNLALQTLHPWGPVTSSENTFLVMQELSEQGVLTAATADRFATIHQEWKTIQMMFIKSTFTSSTELLEQIIGKLGVLADWEHEAFTSLDEQIKVVAYE
ncbi:hypothetical protein [Brevibacillus dissolubilis]|uniref:hypothetical protein n=1 Tax=Brevibacillus dissolubilis TaxID=1844116 RepID=UPI0011165C88|nr:hypothetical protein [Brevibacillus dissolubilis]